MAGRRIDQPSANVEIVRQSLDAFVQRDVDTMRALNDPDLVLDWSASMGWLAGVYRGFDDALRFYEGYFEAFQTTAIVADRYIETGESVVVPNVTHQTGREGIEVSARGTLVFTLSCR